MTAPLDRAVSKLRADGAPAPVIAAFARRHAQLEDPAAGLLPGDTLGPVRDLPALEVLALRARHGGARLPLVLMDSVTTRDATLAALERHPSPAADVPFDFLQSREPKLRADTLEPVAWPADPALEWRPPGHGDLYVSLAASAMLGRLRAAGYDWAYKLLADAERRFPAGPPSLRG